MMFPTFVGNFVVDCTKPGTVRNRRPFLQIENWQSYKKQRFFSDASHFYATFGGKSFTAGPVDLYGADTVARGILGSVDILKNM